MKTRAAVAFEAKRPLEIVELDLEGPRAGEVLVEIMATGICHTDAYTLDGLDSEGLFPSVLGHEGAGVVREVGAGVTSVVPGDHVVLSFDSWGSCPSCSLHNPSGCYNFNPLNLKNSGFAPVGWTAARRSPTRRATRWDRTSSGNRRSHRTRWSPRTRR